MAGLTPHYGLQTLDQGDPFSTNSQKYTDADRQTIDRLLYDGATGHHHTGALATDESPTSPPSLAVDTTSGYLPAANRVTYVYTYVDPSGAETSPSPATFVDLPAQTATPGIPGIVAVPGTGSLPSGGYFYPLSAYTGSSNTNETPSSAPAYATLASTGEIILTLPTLPSGASGFNVYRKGPSEANYVYLTSIDMTGGSPPTTFTDNGTFTENTNRLAPQANTTQSNNNVTVTIPNAPPSGWTWNLYRTLVSNQWTNSFLISITTTGLLAYQDMGTTTSAGAPPTSSALVDSPTKVLLTGGAEVQGLLPGSMVDYTGTTTIPYALTFAFPGPCAATTGVENWVCPFSAATITSVQCSLGRGSTPTSQAVIANVLMGSGNTPSYTSIYSTSPQPEVPVGQQIGSPAAPDTTALVAGDSLGADIDQSGGGGTPTDHDLTVTIYMTVTP